MEYQTIVNPTTNRRVSIHGRLGRRILRNYLAHWQRGGGDQDRKETTWKYQGDHNAESFCNEINNHTEDWLDRKVNIIHAKDGAETRLQKKGRIIIPEDADVPCIYDEEMAKLSVKMDSDDEPTTEPLERGMEIQLLTKDSTDD
jgi:hypothetical protein